MKTLVVSALFAASLVLGCGNAETVSTDTAVTDTVAPEDVAEEGGGIPATETVEAAKSTATAEDSVDDSSPKD